MSFEKFKPVIWADGIDKGLEEEMTAYEDTNHSFEGKVEGPGDTIKFKGTGNVTVSHYSDGKLHDVSDPETPPDMTQSLKIMQVDEINFGVDDLDKAQAHNGGELIEHFTQDTKFQLAEHQDAYIYGLGASKGYNAATGAFDVMQTPLIETLDTTAAALTYDTIMPQIDNLLVKLLNNKVSRSMGLVLALPPEACMLLRRNYVLTDTDNSELLKNGFIGRYNHITIKESVNTCRYASGNDTIFEAQLKTKRAIGFAKPFMHLEPYRPEKKFMDAVKGYAVYDGMILRPKEIINWKFKI